MKSQHLKQDQATTLGSLSSSIVCTAQAASRAEPVSHPLTWVKNDILCYSFTLLRAPPVAISSSRVGSQARPYALVIVVAAMAASEK